MSNLRLYIKARSKAAWKVLNPNRSIDVEEVGRMVRWCRLTSG